MQYKTYKCICVKSLELGVGLHKKCGSKFPRLRTRDTLNILPYLSPMCAKTGLYIARMVGCNFFKLIIFQNLSTFRTTLEVLQFFATFLEYVMN